MIAAGDFNSKHPEWNRRTRTPNGTTLHAFTMQNLLNYSKGIPDILYITIVKNREIYLTSKNALSSDHNPVLMLIGNCLNPVQKRKETIDRKKFTEDIDTKFQQPARIDCTNDLKKSKEHFEETIRTAITEASRTSETQQHRRTIPFHPYRQADQREKLCKRNSTHTKIWPIKLYYYQSTPMGSEKGFQRVQK